MQIGRNEVALFAVAFGQERQHRDSPDRPSGPAQLRKFIMSIHPSRRPDINGSALLASLITIGVLSLILASYLSMSQRQTVSVSRSQAWNAAIAVAEGGVEEALAQLNRGVGAGVLNLGVNGWEQKAGGSYGPQQPRYLGSNYYSVVIVPGTAPVIYSTGYTAAP